MSLHGLHKEGDIMPQVSNKPAGLSEEKRLVGRFLQGLEAFRAIDPTMPTQLVYTFLMVAIHERISATEITEMAGLPLSSASRHLRDLGPRNRRKEVGYELVEPHQDNVDIRRKYYTLTPKGRKVFHQIVQVMRL